MNKLPRQRKKEAPDEQDLSLNNQRYSINWVRKIRKKPDPESKTVGWILKGERLEIIDVVHNDHGFWRKILHKGRYGYIRLSVPLILLEEDYRLFKNDGKYYHSFYYYWYLWKFIIVISIIIVSSISASRIENIGLVAVFIIIAIFFVIQELHKRY